MKILLFGKDGQVGWELGRSLAPLGELRALGHRDVDLLDLDSLRTCVRAWQPDIIVNAAAYTAVDRAEKQAGQALAHRINALAPGVLAEEAQGCGAWLVHYSTDYVFDGRKQGAYLETDAANPLSVYGRTKFEGEERIRASGARHLILRTGWVFGRHGDNFLKTVLLLGRERRPFDVVADQHGAPTSAELLADTTMLAVHRIVSMGDAASALSGTYHVTAGGQATWHAYACHILAQGLALGVQLRATPKQVVPIAASDWPAPTARPLNSLLDTGKFRSTFGLVLPDWRHHVDRLIAELAERGNP